MSKSPAQDRPAVAATFSTDLVGSLVETAGGERGVVRAVAVIVDPVLGAELHLWIERRARAAAPGQTPVDPPGTEGRLTKI